MSIIMTNEEARPYFCFKNPELSDWQLELSPGYFVAVLKGNEPNWFWRKMHYLAFGFKWRKR
jgi:hypothetical protein